MRLQAIERREDRHQDSWQKAHEEHEGQCGQHALGKRPQRRILRHHFIDNLDLLLQSLNPSEGTDAHNEGQEAPEDTQSAAIANERHDLLAILRHHQIFVHDVIRLRWYRHLEVLDVGTESRVQHEHRLSLRSESHKAARGVHSSGPVRQRGGLDAGHNTPPRAHGLRSVEEEPIFLLPGLGLDLGHLGFELGHLLSLLLAHWFGFKSHRHLPSDSSDGAGESSSDRASRWCSLRGARGARRFAPGHLLLLLVGELFQGEPLGFQLVHQGLQLLRALDYVR
mmetsp:Transcript_96130/g.206234  ORF Transcript_96130/g.206234 Transcript_96130/m.206234 type:complete len:281 (-) Transcript_96130:822-1664(-)